MPNPHSYPLWLLSRPLEVWQNVHSPIQATKFFVHQFESIANRTRWNKGWGSGDIPGYWKMGKITENHDLFGYFWYVLVFPWPAWEWLGAFVVKKVASTRRGPAVHRFHGFYGYGSTQKITSPVLLVKPLSLLVNLSCVLANPHFCWLKPPSALLKTTIFCWFKPLFSLVKQGVSTTTEPWLHFLILRTYYFVCINLHVFLKSPYPVALFSRALWSAGAYMRLWWAQSTTRLARSMSLGDDPLGMWGWNHHRWGDFPEGWD